MARNSRVILCKNIKMDRQYKNVIDYSENDLLNLCVSNKVAEKSDCSLINNENAVEVSISYDKCLQSNYIAFQNPNYTNKWFFAWIDDIKIVSPNCCRISYTLDIFSTWFKKLTLHPVFINREHVNDDTIGLHTIPEDLKVGEIMEEDYEELLPLKNDGVVPYDNKYNFVIVVETTHEPILNNDYQGICIRNSNINGCYTFYFEYNTNLFNNLLNFIKKTNQDGKISSIKNIYITHKNLVQNMNKIKHGDFTLNGMEFYELLNTDESINITNNIRKITSFDNLTIKNNKCFVYPYNFLQVSNNIGNNLILKYEDFKQNIPVVEIEMALSIGGSIRLVPKEYKNIDKNINESISLGKYPVGSWSSDAFINWLTLNGVDLTYKATETLTNIVKGDVSRASTNIANLIGSFVGADLQPSITGGQNCGDVNFSAMENVFALHYMRAKDEYMKIIDDYFTKFGYKINKLKIPNITGRQYWNYVEIAEGEIIGYGEIPSLALEEINKIFYNGTTIWHNHANIGNYNLENSIVE